MGDPFIGSESVASGRLSPYALRSRFVAMHPDVYIATGSEVTAITRAQGAWLWSRRQGVVAGQSAAALHGAKWVDARRPAEMLWHNRRPPNGIHAWSDGFDTDEVDVIGGIRVTTPARTALDLACRYRLGEAVAAIDALARATHLKMADVELLAARYRGRRGIRKARTVLDLVDPGAESPKETWLRLLVIRNGFPRPQTQIPVYDEYGALVAVLDMGWEDIKLALDYEGNHHRDAVRFNKDIRRHDDVTELGWMDIRVTSRDTEGGIIGRLTTEWSRRT
jgi:AbiEi antitoxin C-terminal domain